LSPIPPRQEHTSRSDRPARSGSVRQDSAFAILALLAILPILSYAAFGYAGHDLQLHLSSWLEIQNAWREGQLFPAWSSLANFTLGDPHLLYYPPLSMLLGAILTLILPLQLAPAAFLWLAVLASGLAMYFASRPFVAPRDRLPAAILYMLSPYLVTSALVRFAAAELLVQAWLPFILLVFYQAVSASQLKQARRPILLLAPLLGLSWLTNLPESIVLLYALLPAVFTAWRLRSVTPILSLLLAEAVAATLAAFYLLPLWLEQGWIQRDTLLRTAPTHLLLLMPFHGPHPEPLKLFKYGLWLFACTGAVLIALCLWSRRVPRTPQTSRPIQTWTALALTAFLFQLPLAIPLWNHLPELRFAAFPFQFLPLLGVTLPLILLAPGTSLRLRKPTYACLALLTLIPFAEHIRTQASPLTRQPRLAPLAAQWDQEGYAGVPEFVPTGAIRPLAPPEIPLLGPTCSTTVQARQAAALTLSTQSQTGCQARIAVFFYPYWKAMDESHTAVPVARSPEGLLLLTIPPGEHTLKLAFHPASKTRTAGRALTLFAACLIVAGLLGWRPTPKSSFAPFA
jgi:hypothetical protein